MKLEKLSEEQEKLMLQVRDEWIDLALKEKTNGINKKMFEEGIEWLYKDLLNKPKPKVIYCDSWLSCLITIAILKNSNSFRNSVSESVSGSVWNSVSDSVRDSVRDSVSDRVSDRVSDSVWGSVSGSVWNSVWDSVWGSVRDSVRNSVRDSVRNSVRDSVSDRVRDSVSDRVRDSVRNSVRNSVSDSVWGSVSGSVWNSVWDSVWGSVSGSVSESVSGSVWGSVRNSVSESVSESVRDSVSDSVRDSVRNSVRNSVRDSVRDSVSDRVSDRVSDSVWGSVRNSVSGSVWSSVSDSVWSSVSDSVRDSVWNRVRNSVRDSVRNSVSEFSSYIGYSNYGWVSFYDFFEKINLLDNFNFKQYKKLIKSNCFAAYEYENYVFAIQPPIVISKNSLGRLHDINKASVIFKDGSEYFYIQGRNIAKELFEKLKSGNYLISDFIKENDEEIKSACIAYLQEVNGDNYLINFFRQNLKEIDTYVDRKEFQYLEGTTKGMNIGVYTLLKGVINNVNIAYVRCYCPSTDRMFFLGVSSVYNNAKDAIASLYRVPKLLCKEIKDIKRQGERYSTTFTTKGIEILKNISKKEAEDLVSITGHEYFSKIKYEF
jgi:hypothetical protein